MKRYIAGEHQAVYDDLLRLCRQDGEAEEIAFEMMRRVRHNLEVLRERWRAEGFRLIDAIGLPQGLDDIVARLEARNGPLPVTLRSFYRVVGWINFVELPPGIVDVHDLRPEAPHGRLLRSLIQSRFMIPQGTLRTHWKTARMADAGGWIICLFGDELSKFDISGDGDVYFPLTTRGFDADLHFEGDLLRWGP